MLYCIAFRYIIKCYLHLICGTRKEVAPAPALCYGSGMADMSSELAHFPEKMESALEAAADGKPWRYVAEVFGCSVRQLFRYMLKYPPFSQSLHRARELGYELRADQVNTLVEDNEVAESPLSPDLLRIKADCMKWYLAVSKPSKFGQRQTITVERPDVAGALADARARARPIAPGLERAQRADGNERSEYPLLSGSVDSIQYNGDESPSPLLVDNGAALPPLRHVKLDGESAPADGLTYDALMT